MVIFSFFVVRTNGNFLNFAFINFENTDRTSTDLFKDEVHNPFCCQHLYNWCLKIKSYRFMPLSINIIPLFRQTSFINSFITIFFNLLLPFEFVHLNIIKLIMNYNKLYFTYPLFIKLFEVYLCLANIQRLI